MRAFNPTGWSLYAVSHITWRISWAKLAVDHYLKDPYDMEIVPRVNISTVNHADSPFNRYHAKGCSRAPSSLSNTLCTRTLRHVTLPIRFFWRNKTSTEYFGRENASTPNRLPSIALDLEEDEERKKRVLTARRNSGSCRARSACSPNRSPGN